MYLCNVKRQKDNKHISYLIKRKDDKMKKIVLTLAALFTMTSVTFAENEVRDNEIIVKAYDFRFDTSRMSNYLGLDFEQARAVSFAHNRFCNDMKKASLALTSDRKELTNKAINRNLRYMKQILDRDQYRKYLMVLNATLNNRGLIK